MTRQIGYLKKITTDIGIIQHTKGNKLDFSHGYTLDDNARALTACILLLKDGSDKKLTELKNIYLAFVKNAQTPNGWFINFFDAKNKPLENRGSDEAFGRTTYALSLMPPNKILAKALTQVKYIKSVRGKALALKAAVARKDRKQAAWLSKELLNQFKAHAGQNWHWFENELTYANALLPGALAYSGQLLKNREMIEIAEKSFQFLDKVYQLSGVPAPIGNKGWYPKKGKRAVYDEQPIEAAGMVPTAAKLYQATKKPIYKKIALTWWSWFHGNNIKKVVLLNELTGGIFDGITAYGVNPNQGSENITMYLIAGHALKEIATQNEIKASTQP